jgi:hypothetical protein
MYPYRQVVLAARPKGLPRAGDFRLETGPLPELLEGQVLVATKFLSLDPYMRGRMNDAESYAPPVNVGGVMEGEVVAEVVRSWHPSFGRGELVQGRIGWRTHAAVAPRDLQRVETGLNPPQTSLGVLGMPGFTAYAGLQAIGQPKPGETVVVSSAAGAVGSVVGQLAQLAGARAVGIAGGAAKCAYVRDELGFDAAVDYKARGLSQALTADCVGNPRWQVARCDLEQWLGLERESLREDNISLAHVGWLLHPLSEEHTLEREGAGCKQPNIARLSAKRTEVDDRSGPFSQEVSDVAEQGAADTVDRDVNLRSLGGGPCALLPAGCVRRKDRRAGQELGELLRAHFASHQPDDFHASVGQELG